MEHTLAHEIFQSVIEAGFFEMDARHGNIYQALEAAAAAGEISSIEESVCLEELNIWTRGWGIYGIMMRNGLEVSNEAIRDLFINWDNRPEVNHP